MGIACNSKVLIWKRSQEEVFSSLLFICDIKRNQIPELEEDDMDIEVVVDITEETVSTYPSFNKPTYELCLELINDAMNKRGQTVILNTILDDVIYLLQNEKIPHFRFVLLFLHLIN